MSDATFDKGLAFVFEGDTEKYFYINLLKYFCDKNTGYTIRKYDYEAITDSAYIIESSSKSIIVYTNTVGTITQIAHSGNWFMNHCAKKYPSQMPWDVFLCYDTDSHEKDISKFHEGDWKKLRENISKRKNIKIIDMAASAEIEDVFLTDLKSISTFLEISSPLVPQDIPNGRKGKVKLSFLFRKYGKYYHEGQRAQNLIESLDKNTLIESGIMPFSEIEKSIVS